METKRINKNEEKNEKGEYVMIVENFVRYQGKCYDVGTRLKYRDGDKIREGTIAIFDINQIILKTPSGGWDYFSKNFNKLENKIVEIIEPVYYTGPMPEDRERRIYPSYDAIFNGWCWYIAGMLFAFICEGGWTLMILISFVFFSWKRGYVVEDKEDK